MISGFIRRLKRAFGVFPTPLAVFIDAAPSADVRYELFPRFISRTSLSPRRDPKTDGAYFMSGLPADPRGIQDSIGISNRNRPPDEQTRLDDFLSKAVACVKDFREAGIPAFAPMATPGINDIFFAKGQEFITTKAIPVFVHVSYYAPTSGGGDGKLPTGVRIRVTEDSVDYSKSTYCEVLEPHYSELEEVLVRKREITNECYAGYSVSIENHILRYYCTSRRSETSTGNE